MVHQHDTVDFDWDERGNHLEREAELHSTAVRETIEWAQDSIRDAGSDPGRVRRVLDLGCGPGSISCLLAQAFPEAEVVAVDGSAELLKRARGRARECGVGERLRTRVAQLPDQVEELGKADLVWVGNFLHHLGDQAAALKRMGGLLNPGGTLVLLEGGLPTRFLPRSVDLGRPGLQTRLDGVTEEWFTAMRAELPEATEVAEDWPNMITSAGLAHSGTRTFLTDHPAPVDASTREYLHAQLSSRRDMMGDRLDADDLAVVDRLLDAADDSGILRRPDVFLLSARTAYLGRNESERSSAPR